MNCGHRALVALARHHGVTTTVRELSAVAPPDADGISLADLQRGAAAVGLDAQAVKGGPLADLPFPLIAHVDGRHWLFAEAPTEELARRWSGFSLVVLPATGASG